VRREGANKSSKASACRRYTRRIGVSFSWMVVGSADKSI
jgi:hypothetical protein